MIIGLTGSLGSGKSTVARMFTELGGAHVIDADEITRQVQQPGASAYEEIVSVFERGILNADGTLNRLKLAETVFADSGKLDVLNSIVHPKVRAEEIRQIEEHRGKPLVVLMVPLLLENRMQELVDRVVVVVVSDQTRRRRLRRRPGMTPEAIDRRLAAQMPDAAKTAMADFVINNDGALRDTRKQVAGILDKSGFDITR